ncbi:MAG: excinuclease ABC subunit UvrA [Verrucomicrobiae bacterium]|nr:excinuclease ABC subunit UvrA [Verrucomicrobiae bacterium]NNJ43507.1 excinuclease ABC subunit UvrA [Akkermansiaceae bacterium]
MPAKKTPKTRQKKGETSPDAIRIHGARQHNLKNLDLEIPLRKLTVITGPSGSGKSSLAFHTLYAEGQRRYVETFSPYVRQFLDRMDKPAVDRIDGIPAAIAIEQKNTIRSTRSTVGTLTELNDYLKLLFPYLAEAFDPSTGEIIQPDHTDSIAAWCHDCLEDQQTLVTFPVSIPAKTSASDVFPLLNQQGYTRIYHQGKTLRTDDASATAPWSKNAPTSILIVQDRLKITPRNRARLLEAIGTSLTIGKGNVEIISDTHRKSFSTQWTNPATGFTLRQPTPALFSFNSPLGACPHCRGFGRTIGIDLTKAIPDPSLSIEQGCVAPFTTARGAECQSDLLRAAQTTGVDIHTPYQDLKKHERQWLLHGERDDSQDAWENNEWYGVKGFFDWCETKSYKMHVRVFLSRYRAYTSCPHCHGSRLQPEALCFKIHGKTLPDLWLMPIDQLAAWMKENLSNKKKKHHPSIDHALTEINSRLHYLCEVGLSYLNLDRPANTLSGGEIERVNLTTCLGAALTNTLFVLDEPTVGLHQRDINQLVRVMQDLRDKGNTVVVVEHEESVMLSCDHLIDLGPAAGEHGGNIVAAIPGRKAQQKTITRQHPESQTLPYLSGLKQIPTPSQRRKAKHHLRIKGATKHNINKLDIDLPLGVITCLTGVSGSGKSTLAHDILYLNLAQQLGITATNDAAPIKKITGTQHLSSVEQVDQSPLTRTPRSTPAVHSGAFEAIRQLYAQTPKAVSDKRAPGYFSFNSGNGRCQRCLGNGFEKVEMQFLSDLYITCPECEGKRYTQQALDYHYQGRHIAQTLALTVTEAVEWMNAPLENVSKKEQSQRQKIQSTLQPLIDVGLGYLRLGQPLNTLSGGESQRLKLCKILTDAAPTQTGKSPKTQRLTSSPRLLILDEPTTGLHFTDIEKLLGVFHRLTEAGHSLLVIEHNLDVIRSADHIIDLGPGPGNKGGNIVFTGTPEEILSSQTATAKALTPDKSQRKTSQTSTRKAAASPSRNAIAISGAREHNLKNISVDIPRDELVVVTGLSGSGKSTLAFDIVFAEGQRRFLDSMSPYARQFAGQLEKPDIDRITGLPPTVAIEQRVSRGGGKSTTGTVTEIYHFLRLLYAKLGVQHCPDSGEAVISQTQDAIEKKMKALRQKHQKLRLLAPLVRARKGYHTDVAKTAARRGISHLFVDGKLTATDGFQALKRYVPHDIYAVCETVEQALTLGRGHCSVLTRSNQPNLLNFSTARVSPVTGKSFDDPDPHHFSFNSHRGWCPYCRGYGTVSGSGTSTPSRKKNDGYNSEFEAEIHENLTSSDPTHRHPCPECHGARLREESRHVLIHGKAIHQINNHSVVDSIQLFEQWKFTGRDHIIARDILPEIIQRLHFLHHVGLGYLQLNRSADTLSGGESQRIRLAAQLGSNLRGVLYVLDEPTIGLHPRDNIKLLDTLEALRDRGNSLLVVEHDDETIARASTLIELGPGAGILGGELIKSSTKNTNKPTTHTYPRRKIPKVSDKKGWIKLTDCHANNLQHINARIPLTCLTVLTGVSGCGKSSLMRGCISTIFDRKKPSQTYQSASGHTHIKHCFEVDQTPIGKTSRSCPATYVKLFDTIRQLFAQIPDARTRGFTASRFSFNNKDGQCPECKGNGRIKLEMDFLPTTWVPCEACMQMRYNPATLDVRYQGKNIGEVLQMSIRQAADFFAAVPKLHRTLGLLSDTGLGYLQLGQPSPTLSGGEAQRIKLVAELTKGRKSVSKATLQNNNLYLIEEPSIGLHQEDVEKLIDVLHRLVDEGHTVIVIEHHTTIMAEADYIIDIGPEAGEKGGNIVSQGPPEHVAKSKTSRTAPFLQSALRP